MSQLTQKYIATPVPTISATNIPFVKPLAYEFRVAEFVDDDGKITKVALQMQVWEHDEYGAGIVKQFWHDVPRTKFDKNGSIIPPV